MNTTIKLSFAADEALQQMLIAELSTLGFDGFEETTEFLHAFGAEDQYDAAAIEQLAAEYNVSFSMEKIAAQNWNALWESNFQPVRVDDFCQVRAEFHTGLAPAKYEILITPKMSFGTGHHATTYMMVAQMEALEFTGKSVMDFGTGTGILAILADKMGAATVDAIDNDEWSITNAQENIEKNHCANIRLEKAEALPVGNRYDIILANINRNILLAHAQRIAASLNPGATLLLSGLLTEDEAVITSAFTAHNISHENTLHRNGWISIMMKMAG